MLNADDEWNIERWIVSRRNFLSPLYLNSADIFSFLTTKKLAIGPLFVLPTLEVGLPKKTPVVTLAAPITCTLACLRVSLTILFAYLCDQVWV